MKNISTWYSPILKACREEKSHGKSTVPKWGPVGHALVEGRHMKSLEFVSCSSAGKHLQSETGGGMEGIHSLF